MKKIKKNALREYAETFLFAFIGALIIRIFVVEAYGIPTGSMKDTFLIGDRLLVNKFIYGVRTPDRIPLIDVNIPHTRLPAFTEPEQGDVVVFKYPLDEKLNYVKRCLALPGQTIEVRNGQVFVDGKPEGESKFIKRQFDAEEGAYIRYYQITMANGKTYTIRHYETSYPQFDNFGPIKVPKDFFFMMGDNRDNSADSRSWGFVPRDNILGKPLLLYWSWNSRVPFYRFYDMVRFDRIGKLIN